MKLLTGKILKVGGVVLLWTAILGTQIRAFRPAGRVLVLLWTALVGTQTASAQDPVAEHLSAVLTTHPWMWTESGTGTTRQVSFRPDGTVVAANGDAWKWALTGPGTIRCTIGAAEEYVDLFFNDSLSSFSGNDTHSNAVAFGSLADGKQDPSATAITTAASPTATDMSSPYNATSAIEVVTRYVPQFTEWVALPLDREVPVTVRRTLIELRVQLREEETKYPQASPESYALATRICIMCDTALAFHDESARRGLVGHDHVFAAEALANWARATAAYREGVNGLFSKYREAVRLSPRPVHALPLNGLRFAHLPLAPLKREHAAEVAAAERAHAIAGDKKFGTGKPSLDKPVGKPGSLEPAPLAHKSVVKPSTHHVEEEVHRLP